MIRTRIFLSFLMCATCIVHGTINTADRPSDFTDKVLITIIGGMLYFAASMVAKDYEIRRHETEVDKLLPLQLEALKIQNKQREIEYLQAEERLAQTHNNNLKILGSDVNKYCGKASPYKNDELCMQIQRAYINHVETMNNKNRTITIIQ